MLYYNPNWRVLAEYDGSNNLQQKSVFGNYIDEVLFMIDSDTHNHLRRHINTSPRINSRYLKPGIILQIN